MSSRARLRLNIAEQWKEERRDRSWIFKRRATKSGEKIEKRECVLYILDTTQWCTPEDRMSCFGPNVLYLSLKWYIKQIFRQQTTIYCCCCWHCCLRIVLPLAKTSIYSWWRRQWCWCFPFFSSPSAITTVWIHSCEFNTKYFSERYTTIHIFIYIWKIQWLLCVEHEYFKFRSE